MFLHTLREVIKLTKGQIPVNPNIIKVLSKISKKFPIFVPSAKENIVITKQNGIDIVDKTKNTILYVCKAK